MIGSSNPLRMCVGICTIRSATEKFFMLATSSATGRCCRKRAAGVPCSRGLQLCGLRDGRIADYREVANTGPGFVDMNFAPERIVKILRRQGDALKARPELARHLA